MAAPVDVNVNPSSSTQASSGAGSGFGGGLTFAFGGNPNLAFLTAGPAGGITGAVTSVAKYAAIAVAVAGVAWLLLRRRR